MLNNIKNILNLLTLDDIIFNNINSLNLIEGPLDQFNVTALIGLNFGVLGNFYLALTNISLYLALVLAVIVSIFYFGDNDYNLIPNK
jgi:hypothetical protein